MDTTSQKEFMYLFERIGEPLYFGPRGRDNVLYNVPVEDASKQKAEFAFRSNINRVSTTSVDVSPMKMPNLSGISRLCPKSAIFSYFSENHLQAAENLKKIFVDQKSRKEFMGMASVCRDSEMINGHMWVFAFASAALDRKDMKGFRVPAFWEIVPDLFVSPTSTRMAQQQAMLPESERKVIELSKTLTGSDVNPENKLAYFREDIGINSHHWHWHLIYTSNAEKGKRNRKGELFYYMHHSMLARYNADRLAIGLNLVKKIGLPDEGTMEEGYFPKLYNTRIGKIWGSRQERTEIASIDRMEDGENPTKIDLTDLRKWRDRISEAIDTGNVIGPNGTMMRLTEENGIDILGDIIESSSLTPNQRVYGRLHNTGHVVIAFAHDPYYKHREGPGVMVDTATAMRDPLFFRWHAYIDELFDKYKITLKPYSKDQLAWKGIQVTDLSVQTPKREKNILVSKWMQSDMDLARGLDLRRLNGGPVWARTTHLDHESFEYTIQVTNSGPQAVNGTIRIFMAPRLNEQGRRFNMNLQRNMFFEMDKFAFLLKPGNNLIQRKSEDSTITIPWESSFRDLETMMDNPTPIQSVCGCGWPQHMLVPKGTPPGMIFDLYVIITNGAEDQIRRKSPKSQGEIQNCKEALSFCGVLDEDYPDKRAMGYPFDRLILPQNNTPISLDAFVQDVPNSRYIQIKIQHLDVTTIRGNGAPPNMPTMPDTSSRPSSPINSKGPAPISPFRPTSPTGNRNRRPGSPESPARNSGSWNWPSNNNRFQIPSGRDSNSSGSRYSGSGRKSRDNSPNGWTIV